MKTLEGIENWGSEEIKMYADTLFDKMTQEQLKMLIWYLDIRLEENLRISDPAYVEGFIEGQRQANEIAKMINKLF